MLKAISAEDVYPRSLRQGFRTLHSVATYVLMRLRVAMPWSSTELTGSTLEYIRYLYLPY